jgi:hypothetical protein
MAKDIKNSSNDADKNPASRLVTLELTSLVLVGLLTVGALITAIGYDLSSSRPLFVILVPLVLLIAVQIYRTMRAAGHGQILPVISAAFAGRITDFAVASRFFLMLLALLLCIYVLGHYAGLFLAMFYLIRIHGGESLKMALVVPAITAMALFGLFDLVFSIELFQGQLYRYFAGYRIW